MRIIRVIIIMNVTCEGPASGGYEGLIAYPPPLFFNVFLCRYIMGVVPRGTSNLLFGVNERTVSTAALTLCRARNLGKYAGTPRAVGHVRIRQ